LLFCFINDYITKPVRQVEFIARIKAALLLKKEMSSRKKAVRDLAIANCISGRLKRSSDFAARYGGEEFIVILPNTELPGAKSVAEEINRAVLDLKIEHRGAEAFPYLSISCGVACIKPDPKISPPKLLLDADIALYKAKGGGRNCVRIFE
jgi:diguanylate cyclase (GGDEF)-like protein